MLLCEEILSLHSVATNISCGFMLICMTQQLLISIPSGFGNIMRSPKGIQSGNNHNITLSLGTFSTKIHDIVIADMFIEGCVLFQT